MRVKEIALLAGVSTATVSRVLNEVPTVNPEYRERVLAVVREHGYRPNQLARQLRLRRAENIGVVVADIENPHFAEWCRALEDAAFVAGYRIHICNTDEDPDKQAAYLAGFAQERPVGVIISPSNADSAEISNLLDEGIHVVAFDRAVGDPRADALLVDNRAAGRLATRHLIEAGYRKIVYIGGRASLETVTDRAAGYADAVEEAGLAAHAVYGDHRIENGAAAIRQVLASGRPFDAIVGSSNLVTAGALQVLQKERRIPDEAGVVGIDDPLWNELVTPRLSAVAQPIRRMAHEAVRLLTERADGKRAEPVRVVVTPELRARESSARTPAQG